jgi:hypothetical protein
MDHPGLPRPRAEGRKLDTPHPMNLKPSFSANGTAETFLAKRGLWILLAFTLGYYGYYFNVWPGPGGEGGVAALLSQRLLQGQRPIVDTFLGYNVLWFYPIVGIFKVLGPHYLAMRIFFFVLCTLTDCSPTESSGRPPARLGPLS